MRKRLFLISIISVMMIMLAGCSTFPSNNQVQESSKVLQLQGAKLVKAHFIAAIGQFHLDGTSQVLMNADFQYNQDALKPKISYDVNGEVGNLEVGPSKSHIPMQELNNTLMKWNIHINEQIPLELQVDTGVGKSDLQVNQLNIQYLKVNTGVGDTTISLNGKWNKSFNVHIATGIGKTTIILPRNFGVKIKAVQGIGKINTNRACSKSINIA